MILITQYYEDNLPERQNEIDFCIRKNIEHPDIEKIFLYMDKECESVNKFVSNKIEAINLESRLTYRQAFNHANIFKNQICIITNTDIYFDDTLKLLNNYNFLNKFLAITRHQLNKDQSITFCDCESCQDTWIFKSPIVNFPCDFPLGIPGCDNRIAWESINSKLNVINPCKSLRCIHYHISKKFNYDSTTTPVPGPRSGVPFSSL